MLTSKTKTTKYMYIFLSVLLAALPIFLCIIRVAISGKVLTDVSILNSNWSDEAFYYKQVDAVVNHRIPLGYFGYNESHSEHLSFGAWNPTILFPWCIWGKLFGWNYFSPILCNIVIFSFSLLIFGFLSKINWKQSILIAIPLICFMPLSRFLLSGMPETNIISILIIVFGIFLSAKENYKLYKIVLQCILLFFLVTIRPYLTVFFILPFFNTTKVKKRLWIILLLIMFASILAYSFIASKFTAPYFENIYTNWLDKAITHGPRTVLNEILGLLRDNWITMFFYIKLSFSSLNAIGAYFFSFLLCTSFWLVNLCIGIIKKEKDSLIFSALVFLSHVALLLAILVMYNLFDGYRHLITFLVFDIIAFAFEKSICLPFAAIKTLCFIVLFIVKGAIPEMYAIPFEDGSEYKYEQLADELSSELSVSNELSWDNTCIILYDDYTDGIYYTADWHYIYSIPSGMGISLCSIEYINQHLDSLSCKYALIPVGGLAEQLMSTENDALYTSANMKLIQLH